MRKSVMYHMLLSVTLFILVEGQVGRYLDDAPEIIKDSATVTKAWDKMENLLKDLVNKGMKTLMPILIDNMEGVNISSSCMKQALQVIRGIRNLQPWAMRFLDSSAKGLDGGITGTLYSFGDYDECIDTVAIRQDSSKHKGEVTFTGKYCTLRIKPPLPPRKPFTKLGEIIEELREVAERGTVISEIAKYAPHFYYVSVRLGLCVPSGCAVNDINQLFTKVSSATGLYMKVQRCEVKDKIKLTPLMISVMCVYSFVGLLVLLASLTDVYYYYTSKLKPNSTPARVLFAFSFLSNFRKLVDTSTPHKDLSCLNGLRFLTMSWIILSHTYLYALYQIVSGLEYVKERIQEFAAQTIHNAQVSVETFFFIGGFLVCYNATNYVKIANKKLNVWTYIFHRLWRILPCYTFVLLFTFLLPLISSGPIAYSSLQAYAEGCKKAWWSKLLFMSNLHHGEDTCLPHGWYLSVDMQLYIGALIILLPLFRWPKVGVSIAVACAVGFMITTGVMTYINGHPPTALFGNFNAEKLEPYLKGVYEMAYPHATSYIIGIMVGYLIATNPKLKLPKMIQIFGWPIAFVLAMPAVFGTYEWNGIRDPTFWEGIFYSSCHRTAWTLSIAWLFTCCVTGHGGVINYILSWKAWIPLGRLTFVSYLVHPLVQITFTAHMRTPIPPTHVMGVWLFFGHLMATYGIAFAGSMLIESPFLALGNLVFSQRDDNRPKSKEAEAPRQTANNTETEKEKDTENMNHIYLPKQFRGEDNEVSVCRL